MEGLNLKKKKKNGHLVELFEVNDSREAVGPVLLSRSSGSIVIISARLPFVFVVMPVFCHVTAP